jgi:hypothetical protein
MPHALELDLWARGYRVLFHRGEPNRCPGCGKSQWLVGRTTAECALCATALPLADAEHEGFSPLMQKAVVLRVVKAPAGHLQRRREERSPGDGRVLALHVDGSVYPFAIHNISPAGVMGDAELDFATAGPITVELEDGTLLPAELKWADGTVAGMAFLRSVSDD